MVEITAEAIREIIKHDGERMMYYMTPELNNVLYLHFKGWKRIGKGLEEYVGLRSLWLESNALSKIEGLQTLVELRCLFLQDNLISDISGLNCESLSKLDTINLAGNRIQMIKAGELSQLKSVTSLNLSRNTFEGSANECLIGLVDCPTITVLDLSSNRISDGPALLSILQRIPGLKVLNLLGNPAQSEIPEYRRTVICALKELTFFDDCPVSNHERRLAEAWMRGGDQEERSERLKMRKEEEDRDKRSFELLDQLMNENRTNYNAVVAESPPTEVQQQQQQGVNETIGLSTKDVQLFDVDGNTETLNGTFGEVLPQLEEEGEEREDQHQQKQDMEDVD